MFLFFPISPSWSRWWRNSRMGHVNFAFYQIIPNPHFCFTLASTLRFGLRFRIYHLWPLSQFFRDDIKFRVCEADYTIFRKFDSVLNEGHPTSEHLATCAHRRFPNSTTQANDFCLFDVPKLLACCLLIILSATELNVTMFTSITKVSNKRSSLNCCANNIVWLPLSLASFKYQPNYIVTAPFCLYLGDIFGQYASPFTNPPSIWCQHIFSPLYCVHMLSEAVVSHIFCDLRKNRCHFCESPPRVRHLH